MKRLILGILLSSIAPISHAQSSVTLYGIIDGGIRWVSGTQGGSTIKYSSTNSPSRFGLKGTEDIGGGLQIIFRLENGFNTANGAMSSSNVLWSRQAYAGIDGKYGRLTLGRQFSALEDLIIPLDPTQIGGGDIAIAPNALLAANFFTLDTRFNNNIKYTNTLAGFTLGASYSFGGVAGNTRAGANYAAQVGYSSGPLNSGIAYQRTYNADATQVAQNYYAGASWVAGPVQVFVSYLGLTVSGAAKKPSQRRDDVPQGGLVWQITPAVSLTAAYYDDIASNLGNVRDASGHKQTAYLLGRYLLSKNTQLIAEVDRNWLSGAYRTDPTNLSLLGLSAGSSGATGVSFGIETRF